MLKAIGQTSGTFNPAAENLTSSRDEERAALPQYARIYA